MKTIPTTLAMLALLGATGCFSTPIENNRAAKSAPGQTSPVVTPDFSITAKVVSVNNDGRFVILSCPASRMPKADQSLFLYRGNLKVAEIRVTGQPLDTYIAADIVSGDAQPGDTAAEK